MIDFLPPGSTLGVIGGGQLGRMLILAAHRMGYRTMVLAPDADAPAAQVAGRTIVAAYDDQRAAVELARACDVVTYEFENVPFASVSAAAAVTKVGPSPDILAFAQDRALEKSTLTAIGVPVAPWGRIESEADVERAVESTGLPAVLKTARSGYDGKGQAKVRDVQEIRRHWLEWGQQPCVLEQLVDLAGELSVIVARNAAGQVAVYEPFENIHTDHVLDITAVPADLPDDAIAQAQHIAIQIAQHTQLTGLICVEFFLLHDRCLDRCSSPNPGRRVLVNEIAPRPHNSGHLTIEAHATSQFEQQLRAVANLPLGSTHRIVPAAAMANLLGQHWPATPHHWKALFDTPGLHVHHYGKSAPNPAPKRKLGHLTATASTRDQAIALVTTARRSSAEK
jgi:5-(carboxyamino)imidazole ribonucleotide synthase